MRALPIRAPSRVEMRGFISDSKKLEKGAKRGQIKVGTGGTTFKLATLAIGLLIR